MLSNVSEGPSPFPPPGLPEEAVRAPKPPGRGRYSGSFSVLPPVGPDQQLWQVCIGPKWVGKRQGFRYCMGRPKWRLKQALLAPATPNLGFLSSPCYPPPPNWES